MHSGTYNHNQSIISRSHLVCLSCCYTTATAKCALPPKQMTHYIPNLVVIPLVLSKPNLRAHVPNSELSAGRISATDVNALRVVRKRLVATELDIAMASSTAPAAHNLRVSLFVSPPYLTM